MDRFHFLSSACHPELELLWMGFTFYLVFATLNWR